MPENIHWQKFLKENDEDSFSLIYKNSVKDLYAYGINLGYSADDCMDAVQDIFYKLYFRRNELRHVSNPRVYLFRSFRNRLFDIRKQQKKTHSLEIDINALPIEPSVAEHFENKEEDILIKQKVEKLLSVLTNRQREAIYLRYIQGVEYDEMVTILNMNLDSVWKLVYRALDTIRKNVLDNPLSILILLAQFF